MVDFVNDDKLYLMFVRLFHEWVQRPGQKQTKEYFSTSVKVKENNIGGHRTCPMYNCYWQNKEKLTY